jgi:hypothetical protein
MARVVRFDETGEPEVLRFEDLDVGEPGPGEVRIRHVAVGLNFADTYFRRGTYPVPLPSGIGNEGPWIEEIFGTECLVTNARGDDEPGIEASPCDRNVESGSDNLAVGSADVASIFQKLHGHTDVQNSRVEIDEIPRRALDRLRKTTDEEIDPVLNFDNSLLDDQPLTLIFADFGQESLHAQLGAAGSRLLSSRVR